MTIETLALKDANGVTFNLTVDQIVAIANADSQVIKVGFGADGILTLVDATNRLPVELDATALAALESITAVGPITDAQIRATPLPVAPSTAGDVATTLTDGRKTVTAAGTAEAIRGSLACKWVVVTALRTNTAQVNVGGSGVLATTGGTTGTSLLAGESMTVPVDNASKVFVDARTSGEGVSFTVGS